MVKEIRWTPESIKSFQKIIHYLEENWTDKEIRNFITATNRVTQFIKENPKMFRSIHRQNLREALVTPHNFLIYRIQKTSIDLITFWDVRQHPKKKIKK